MILSTFDWTIIGCYFAISLIIGIWASRKAGKDTTLILFWLGEICHGGYWESPWLPQHFLRIHQI